ncbi:hypothetical protein CTI12_AA020090 [Artemisia annua]|uniref:Uncharacterized protein n=1 Tax=Artemisia annua TaxID=35608 RepID=A0A2U1QK67_ARTAN|nr:hypothetical protein CTI12_AA020090 [Artemisia annua]
MRGLNDNISPAHFSSGIANLQFCKCGYWLIHKAMISVLAQERVLGAALGIALTGALIFDERRFIYKTIAQNQPPTSSSSQVTFLLCDFGTDIDLMSFARKNEPH